VSAPAPSAEPVRSQPAQSTKPSPLTYGKKEPAPLASPVPASRAVTVTEAHKPKSEPPPPQPPAPAAVRSSLTPASLPPSATSEPSKNAPTSRGILGELGFAFFYWIKKTGEGVAYAFSYWFKKLTGR
jgi:hypothetical protein